MRKTVVLMTLGSLALLGQSTIDPEKEAAMKADLAGQIDAMKKQAQVMVDSVFSFGELGFQEFETSRYLTDKGVLAGAKVQAMTMLDILLHPDLVAKAWGYFKDVQTKDVQYKSFLRPDDKPAIWLNKETMDKFRPQMQKLYYDASKYDTYLEQLGIKYPTVR
jgi:hypothetical protein